MKKSDNDSVPIFVVSGGKGVTGHTIVQTLIIQYPENRLKVKLIPDVCTDKKVIDVIKKVKEYYAGKKVDFTDCRLNLDNYTNFQKEILQLVKKIPYGEIRTYKEAAEAAGYPRAYRAVGNTMRNNPLPLIIPCHRVIKSDGGLGGFSGKEGIALKRKMIDLESEGK